MAVIIPSTIFHKNYLLPGCGIIKDDILPILKTASEKNVIIMFRSTGVYAKPWLELGYPSIYGTYI